MNPPAAATVVNIEGNSSNLAKSRRKYSILFRNFMQNGHNESTNLNQKYFRTTELLLVRGQHYNYIMRLQFDYYYYFYLLLLVVMHP